MKKTIYMLLAMVICAASVSAQNDSIATVGKNKKEAKPEKRYKKVYWGLNAGGGQMMWDNDMANYTAETSLVLNGGFFIEFRPIKYIGIETGASYSMVTFEGSVSGFTSTISGVDTEGDNVEYRFAANTVSETQELALLNVPVAIKLNAFAGHWEFFAKGGMEYRHAVKASYEQSGRLANTAYYEQWDLLIDDLPSQGFYSQRYINESGDLLWKDAFEPFVGGGIVFPSANTSFFIEGKYYFGSSDFVEKQASPFSNRIGNIPMKEQSSGSIMEMGKTNMNGFIVNIGLRF